MQDDRELAGLGAQAALQPRARVLELREHALGVFGVALVVARHEGLGWGLEPGHLPGDCRLRRPPSTREDLTLIFDPAIQKLEFKVTVLPAEEPKVQAELRRAGVDPVRRKVYFYDTPELALFAKDLVLRARVTDGDDDDSTVKLRPLPLPDIPAGWSATDGVRIELDVVGEKQVPSAKLDGEPDRGEIEQVEHGALKLSKLFTKAQEALVADGLPSATSLNDLAVLGPVDARKWELPPETFPHKLSVEEWSLPDGHPLRRALLQGGARRSGERGAGVPFAARSPADRPRRRSRSEDPQGAQVLRRATSSRGGRA